MKRALYVSEEVPAVTNNWWITTTVALLAIVVFTVSGSQTIPILIESANQGRSVDHPLISAFLLNIALVLFAWRRSVQLKVTLPKGTLPRLTSTSSPIGTT